MRFAGTEIPGVVVVEIEPRGDARGAFARLHDPAEFAAAGHPFTPAQTSLSRNPQRGTLRGMHYQRDPHAEVKLVRCVRGRIFDVAVDLRAASPTHRRWAACELSADNARALLIPEGVAHGFLTLEPETDVLYQIAPGSSPATRPACAGTTRLSPSPGPKRPHCYRRGTRPILITDLGAAKR